MHTEVNVVDIVFSTKSHVNDVVIFTLEIPITLLKIMEQQFQYVDQKIMNDNSLDSLDAHLAKKFTKKTIPQQCREFMSFGVLSTVNPIGSMKTWGK